MAESGSEKHKEPLHLIATPEVLVVPLTEEHKAAARKCLEQNGEVRFSIKEVSVTRLPEVRKGDGVLVD
jgi:hypothetical protein